MKRAKHPRQDTNSTLIFRQMNNLLWIMTDIATQSTIFEHVVWINLALKIQHYDVYWRVWDSKEKMKEDKIARNKNA